MAIRVCAHSFVPLIQYSVPDLQTFPSSRSQVQGILRRINALALAGLKMSVRREVHSFDAEFAAVDTAHAAKE